MTVAYKFKNNTVNNLVLWNDDKDKAFAFSKETAKVLDKMGGMTTGKALLDAISAVSATAGNTITIEPNAGKFGAAVDYDADPLDPFTKGMEAMKNATASGEEVRWDHDLPDTVGDDTGKPIKDGNTGKVLMGNGKGNKSKLYFNPKCFTPKSPCAVTKGEGDTGKAIDEALFHELVHCLRTIMGKTANRTENMGKTDTWEEWHAIFLTNVYLADKGLRKYRDHHRSFAAIAEFDYTAYLRDPIKNAMIGKFKAQHSTLFEGLKTKLTSDTNDSTDFRNVVKCYKPWPPG